VNEDQLKREIEQALSVEPSPQFMAKVRRELVAEPRRPPVRLPWTLVAAGVAGAVLILAIVVFLPRQSGNSIVKSVPAIVPVTEVPQSVEIETVRPPKPTVTAERKVTPVTAPRRSEPEVLFDPREAAAFRSFVQAVQEKKVNASRLDAFFEAVERADSTIEPMPIAGTPIEIRPLELAVEEKQRGGETL